MLPVNKQLCHCFWRTVAVEMFPFTDQLVMLVTAADCQLACPSWLLYALRTLMGLLLEVEVQESHRGVEQEQV
jgi:hypothetical protein